MFILYIFVIKCSFMFAVPFNVSKGYFFRPKNEWHASHATWSAFGASFPVILEKTVIKKVKSEIDV